MADEIFTPELNVDANDVVDDGVVTTAAEEFKFQGENRVEKKRESESDDCPICLGSLTIRIRGSCGHLYCGDCIMEYWTYAGASKPVKCPLCRRHLSNLSVESSQHHKRKDVLDQIRRYNNRFMRGSFQKFLFLHELRILAMVLGSVYGAVVQNSRGFRVVTYLDCFAIGLFLIFYLIDKYRSRR